MKFLMMIFLLLASESALAGFRCGTHIVKEGDTIARLLELCGTPKLEYWTTEHFGSHGRHYTVEVLHYVYDRDAKNNIIISIRAGTIVNIRVE